MKRNERKVTAKERRLLGTALSNPDHRDIFIGVIRMELVRLDELIGLWYRHRPERDCGANGITKQVTVLCNHLLLIKKAFGRTFIDDYPMFARFVKDCVNGNHTYERLIASERPADAVLQ
jgi:hypothetical protein